MQYLRLQSNAHAKEGYVHEKFSRVFFEWEGV